MVGGGRFVGVVALVVMVESKDYLWRGVDVWRSAVMALGGEIKRCYFILLTVLQSISTWYWYLDIYTYYKRII